MGSLLARASSGEHEPLGEPVEALAEVPDELFRAFFSRLGALDRLRASQVCREWRRLARLDPAPLLVGGRSGLPKIRDAVASSSSSNMQVILLCPGRYEESLLLEKSVHLVGTRRAEVACAFGTTITCKGPCAPSVQGISIRGRANGAILIAGGSCPRFEDCDVSCMGGAATVKGEVSDPTLRSCVGTGVSVCDAGTAPALLRNRVHACGIGLFFYDEADGLAEGNLIERNDWHAAEISFGARPTVRGNVVREQRWGFSVPATGGGRVVGNRLERVETPLTVEAGSSCVVAANTILP